MTGFNRRRFLQGSAGVAVGSALAGPFQGLLGALPTASAAPSGGYGPLVPVADQRDGVVRLELPKGFNYRTFNVTGSHYGSVAKQPPRHDGMAAFRGSRGRTSNLVRNHEINGPGTALATPGAVYDAKAQGGCITVVVDRQGNVSDGWVSLSGTQMNCAGGRTPWNSWISCEETVNGPNVGNDFTGQNNKLLEKDHGYLFEVPSRGRSSAKPIKAAGRFAHEAVAVDPAGGALYLTEDNFNFASGFYRYRAPVNPMTTRKVRDGGSLQMLKVKGTDNAKLHEPLGIGTTYDVEWVDIDDPDPNMDGKTNDQAIVMVGDQGRAKGAALFSRLEGCYHHGGIVYFISTQGGPTDPPPDGGFGKGRGQVFAYHVARKQLRVVYESPGSATLDLPDNVVVSKTGALVLCEDGRGDNFLRGLTRRGKLFNFARNADPTQVGQEFSGATFSRDFHTLYCNIQSSSGYSVAIWGPWQDGPFG